MKYIVTINDKNYEVEVEKGQASIVKTTIAAAAPVRAAIAVSPAPAVTSGSGAPAISGESLKAPMPGSIVAVNVSTGVSVKKGDVLFVLEAMKMESEITAPEDGVVAQVMVAKGTSVSTGQILLTFQSQED